METAKRLSAITFVSVMLLATTALADRGGRGRKPVPTVEDEVVGGSPVPPGKWTDAAGIVFGNSVGCTGVLVAPDVVLTAGHCIGGVSAVILDTNNKRSGDAEVINVVRELSHPDWRRAYDIGILVLARDSSVKPRPIVPECMVSEYVTNGADVAIVGYGALDERGTEYGDTLMEGFTTITDFNCSASVGCKPNARPAGELGAGGMGVDSCYGDSGGPLYLLTDRGDYLVGLTSRGYDDNTIDCSQGGIYARPDAVKSWIERETGRTLPIEGCNNAPLSGNLELTVDAGDTVSKLITVMDPDEGDTHTITTQTPPEHGELLIDANDIAHYTADADYFGPDSLVIAITDDGLPELTGTITVSITVTEPVNGCGCRSGGGGTGFGGLLLTGLVVFGLRRRPS